MLINPIKCVGCGNCVPVCPMGAIYLEGRCAHVDQDTCVECNTCFRFLPSKGLSPDVVRIVRGLLGLFRLRLDHSIDECPTGALEPPALEWPRSVRRAFSDPQLVHDATGIAGRGTEEIKTNDLTGRIGPGEVGVCLDVGRPGVGTRFRDLERVTTALAPLRPTFEPENPVTLLMESTETGRLNPEVLDEKVLSAIIEFKTELARLPEFLRAVERVAPELDTVISIGVASRCEPDGTIPHEAVCREAGYTPSYNGKTNLGLGRPVGAVAGGAAG